MWKAKLCRAVRGTQDPWPKSGRSGLKEECHGNVSLRHPNRAETSPDTQRLPPEIGHGTDHLRWSKETEIGT